MMLTFSDDRANSDSDKWHKYAGKDVIPMWIADSEYEVSPAIKAALHERLRHGVFGYGHVQARFVQAVVNHCAARYEWEIQPEWVVPLTGCVPGLNFCRMVAALRGKRQAVTVEPIYPHFRKHPVSIADFEDVFSPAVLENGRWQPDFADLEDRTTTETGLLLLCHPHNPLGRVYERADLERYADFARQQDLVVCSDEIHCDLVLNGTRHLPFAALNDDARGRTITLMAASKTFNVAGLSCAWAIIADEPLRADFIAVKAGLTGDVNVFGMAATIAALEEGEPWRQEMLAYLRANAALVEKRINATGKLKMTPVEATYLAWIDARALPVVNPQQFFEQHGVGMNDGADFGLPGFVRLNFSCTPEMLDAALSRIERAVQSV